MTSTIVIHPIIAVGLLTFLNFINTTPSCEEGTLDASNEGLTEIPDPSICGQTGPLIALFQGNDFNILRNGSFQGFQRLDVLNISHSNISVIESGCFKGAHSITDVDLSDNPLKTLSGNPFKDLPLKNLYLRGCDLSSFTVEVFSEGVHELVRLSVSYNRLTSIPSGSFDLLGKLADLDLSHNEIEYLDRRLFSHMKDLVSLKLNNNCIVEFVQDQFRGLGNLERVDLSDNPLSKSQVVLSFSSTPHVDLLNCNLTSLPVITSGTASADGFIRVDISNNKLIRCNCSCMEEAATVYDDVDLPIECVDGISERSVELLCTQESTRGWNAGTPTSLPDDAGYANVHWLTVVAWVGLVVVVAFLIIAMVRTYLRSRRNRLGNT